MTTERDPLDHAVLDELRAAMSEGTFTELASTFLEQLRAVGDRFHAAVRQNDRRGAEHAAHELVGIAGTMGAVCLASSAREAMACCRTAGDVHAIAAVVDRDTASAIQSFEDYVRRHGL